MLLSILFVISIIFYRRLKLRRIRNKSATKENYLRETAEAFSQGEMEVDTSSILVYKILGEGAFGVVRKGFLLTKNQDVAVKMLKGWFQKLQTACSKISLLSGIGIFNLIGFLYFI